MVTTDALITVSTSDIGQHNKPLAFGPSSHEDTEAVRDTMTIMKTFIDQLVNDIKCGTLPDVWHVNVIDVLQPWVRHFLTLFV